MTLCHWMGSSWHFEGWQCLQPWTTGLWRWTTAFKMLALTHPMTQSHIQDVILQQTCCENHLQLVHIFRIGNNCNFSGSLNFTTTPWCRQYVAGLPLCRPRFNPRPVHMGSVVYMWQWDRCTLSTSVFSRRYHSKDALYSFIHLPLRW